MIPFNTRRKIEIKDIEDFNEVTSDMFETFLQTFTEQTGLIRRIDENKDHVPNDDCEFIYTKRGQELGERMYNRLYSVGQIHFPAAHEDNEIEIETILWTEL